MPPVNRPEQSLIGIQFTAPLPNTDYVVTNSAHWVYAGTGFRDGDVVPGIVGYEADALMPNYPPPNSANQTLLSQSPLRRQRRDDSHANSSIYQAPSGAWVFAAGTISWSWALDDVPGAVQSLARRLTDPANDGEHPECVPGRHLRRRSRASRPRAGRWERA